MDGMCIVCVFISVGHVIRLSLASPLLKNLACHKILVFRDAMRACDGNFLSLLQNEEVKSIVS